MAGTNRCQKCNRPLSNPKSIQRGMGFTCWKKSGNVNVPTPKTKEQSKLHAKNRFRYKMTVEEAFSVPDNQQ
jgi:hypothetical protein